MTRVRTGIRYGHTCILRLPRGYRSKGVREHEGKDDAWQCNLLSISVDDRGEHVRCSH